MGNSGAWSSRSIITRTRCTPSQGLSFPVRRTSSNETGRVYLKDPGRIESYPRSPLCYHESPRATIASPPTPVAGMSNVSSRFFIGARDVARAQGMQIHRIVDAIATEGMAHRGRGIEEPSEVPTCLD